MSKLINNDSFLLTTSPWLSLNKKDSPYFSKKLYTYAKLGSKKNFDKGESIIEVGDVPTGIYFIEDGIVETTLSGRNGSEKVISYGDRYYFVGIGVFFHNLPVIFRTVTKSDVKAYFFEKQVFYKVLENDFEVALDIMHELAMLVRIYAHQISETLFHSSFEKAVETLYFYSCLQTKYDITISQQELSNIVGVHRVTLANVITDLKKKGIVNTEYGKIVIKDPETLKKLAIENELI